MSISASELCIAETDFCSWMNKWKSQVGNIEGLQEAINNYVNFDTWRGTIRYKFENQELKNIGLSSSKKHVFNMFRVLSKTLQNDVIQNGLATPCDITLARWIFLKDENNMPYTPDKITQFLPFSTSLLDSYSASWGSSLYSVDKPIPCCALHIVVPKGTPSILIGPCKSPNNPNVLHDYNNREFEVLLPPSILVKTGNTKQKSIARMLKDKALDREARERLQSIADTFGENFEITFHEYRMEPIQVSYTQTNDEIIIEQGEGESPFYIPPYLGGKRKISTKIILKGESKARKVYMDASKRKYIRMNGGHIYLSDIRGKYKYEKTI